MNNSYFFIALLLCIALALTFFFPVPAALGADDCWIESAWEKCNDGNLLNGYWWRGDWVPGMITVETHFTPAPQFIYGIAVYYAEGLMEATARYRGLDLSGYVDGVAMMSCADIGQEVWLLQDNRPDRAPNPYYWEGPFLVVDCAEWDDMWPVTVHRKEVVEVGWETAKRWHMTRETDWRPWTKPVYLWKGSEPPYYIGADLQPISYKEWFLENAEYLSTGMVGLPRRPIFASPHKWYINGEWIDFVERTAFDKYARGLYIGIRNMILEP